MDRGTGMFTMEDVTAVTNMRDLEGAKNFARGIINEASATNKNVEKARRMVLTSRTIPNLAIAMSNFILAHSDGKLKVIGAKRK